jgi:hypothetical protein
VTGRQALADAAQHERARIMRYTDRETAERRYRAEDNNPRLIAERRRIVTSIVEDED